jgi:hypothetical protein
VHLDPPESSGADETHEAFEVVSHHMTAFSALGGSVATIDVP